MPLNFFKLYRIFRFTKLYFFVLFNEYLVKLLVCELEVEQGQ